jgi:hypothetical protein
VGITWVTQKLGNLTEIGEVLGYGQKSSCDKYKSSGAGKGLQHLRHSAVGSLQRWGRRQKQHFSADECHACGRFIIQNNSLGCHFFTFLGFFAIYTHIWRMDILATTCKILVDFGQKAKTALDIPCVFVFSSIPLVHEVESDNLNTSFFLLNSMLCFFRACEWRVKRIQPL